VFLCLFFFPEGKASRLILDSLAYELSINAQNDKSCQSFQVLSQLLRKAKQRGLVIPNVKQAGSEQGTYEGATVSSQFSLPLCLSCFMFCNY
jgi:hypothetical protein